MSLTKIDVVESIFEKLDMPKKDCVRIVENVFDIIKSEFVKGNHVNVSGFGKWTVNTKKKRRGRNPHPYGILKGVVDSKSFRKGSWGAEIVDDLKPQPQDIIIEGKRGLCGFASTNLDFILRSRGIKTVVLGGFLTNCCVESTMRTAYEKGYDVVTLKDCTATVGEEEQRLSIEKNYPMFSRVMKHTEFLAALAG